MCIYTYIYTYCFIDCVCVVCVNRCNNDIFENSKKQKINETKQLRPKQTKIQTVNKKIRIYGKISGICATYICVFNVRYETWLRREIKPRIICTWCICFAWMFYGLTVVF